MGEPGMSGILGCGWEVDIFTYSRWKPVPRFPNGEQTLCLDAFLPRTEQQDCHLQAEQEGWLALQAHGSVYNLDAGKIGEQISNFGA